MKNAEKKSVVVLPQIESKELTKYCVTRTATIEFEFSVYAEDSHDAESMVEEASNLHDVSDGCSVNCDSSYYDVNGDVARVEYEYVNSCDWDNIDSTTTGEYATIYKFVDGDWDNECNVFYSEEALIEEYISENDINTDEVEVVKFEDAPSELVQEDDEAKIEFFPSLNFLFWCESVINGDVLSNQVFEMYKDSAIFPNTRFRVSATTIDIEYLKEQGGDYQSCTFIIFPKHFANPYCLYGYIVDFLSNMYESNKK